MKQTPIELLASVARGSATDSHCDDAITREKALVHALGAAYESMLLMRALLAKHADISTRGGPIEASINEVGFLLYPPSKAVVESMAKKAK